MDPYSSPYIIPNNNPYNPFPHSLQSTRETRDKKDCMILDHYHRVGVLLSLGFRLQGSYLVRPYPKP